MLETVSHASVDSERLYDLLKPHVTNLVVCNPRKNALLKPGNKSDRIDARRLADLFAQEIGPIMESESLGSVQSRRAAWIDSSRCGFATPV
jgi:hypothetical protein